jgi:general secretion pathway protein E
MATPQKPDAGRPIHASDPVRPGLALAELCELLVERGLIAAEAAKDVQGRTATLKSRVLRERVGAVRSQAATRYEPSPAELVAAARLAHPKRPDTHVDEDAIAEVLARAADLPYRKLDPLELDSKLVTATISRPFALRHAVVPVGQKGDVLELAIPDPFDGVLRESLESLIRRPLKYVVSARSDILAIIQRVFGFRSSVSRAEEQLRGATQQGALVELVRLRSEDELSGSDQHVVAAVDHLLSYAFDQRASDIHLEPKDTQALVRFRIDGILHDIERVPLSVHGAITSRIKVLARMDVAERRRPQDGRIKTQRDEREVELRVSSVCTAFGEKIVIRVFDPSVLLAELSDLGMSPRERELYERWITAPSGLVLVTGPTGSGKTTTLYSTLRYLSGPEINITSIEDPIEMIDPRFAQVQVQPQIGVSFASALRTILRQDPDVIMVGEIRDGETAQMAIQSALTGHLVFSTVHTRDAAGAVTRLVELGVERFLLASVLRGVMAQRLVRRICPHCAVDGHLTPDQVSALAIKVPVERRGSLPARSGEGCATCRQTGLYGRTGVFELLDVGRRVRQLISEGRDAVEIAHGARVEGMETLREAAIRRLAEGVTTYEEVARVTADNE